MWRNGVAGMQAVGLQGSVAKAAHEHTRTPQVCGHGSGSRKPYGSARKMSPAGIFGSGGLYVRVADIGGCFEGENTKKL